MKDDFKSCCHLDPYITCQVADKGDLKKEDLYMCLKMKHLKLIIPHLPGVLHYCICFSIFHGLIQNSSYDTCNQTGLPCSFMTIEIENLSLKCFERKCCLQPHGFHSTKM